MRASVSLIGTPCRSGALFTERGYSGTSAFRAMRAWTSAKGRFVTPLENWFLAPPKSQGRAGAGDARKTLHPFTRLLVILRLIARCFGLNPENGPSIHLKIKDPHYGSFGISGALNVARMKEWRSLFLNCFYSSVCPVNSAICCSCTLLRSTSTGRSCVCKNDVAQSVASVVSASFLPLVSGITSQASTGACSHEDECGFPSDKERLRTE